MKRKLYLFAIGVAFTLSTSQAADEPNAYLKDGKLTAELGITDLQGGFAGFTGSYYSIAPDGSWTTGQVLPRNKKKETAKGKLTDKQLTELADVLAKNNLVKLPNSGKPTTNPHVITIEFGKVKATLQSPPAGAPPGGEKGVAARYTAIVKAVKELCQAPKKE